MKAEEMLHDAREAIGARTVYFPSEKTEVIHQ
jgi:hypothetical protein